MQVHKHPIWLYGIEIQGNTHFLRLTASMRRTQIASEIKIRAISIFRFMSAINVDVVSNGGERIFTIANIIIL